MKASNGKSPMSKDQILENLMSGTSFKDILDVGDYQIKSWSNNLSTLIDQGKNEEARETALVLVTLDPYDSKLWRLYAKVLRKSGSFQESYDALSFGVGLNDEDPILLSDLASVMINLNMHEDIHKTIFSAEKLIENMSDGTKAALKAYDMTLQDAKDYIERAIH